MWVEAIVSVGGIERKGAEREGADLLQVHVPG